MADLPVWQLTAGFLAALLLCIGVVGFIRYSRPTMLVILGLLIVIPAAGFAAYAIAPGPQPHPTTLLWLAFVPAAVGLGAGTWMLAWMSARRDALTFQNIELLSNGTLIAYGGLVLALSDVVALCQPIYAVANVVVNAAWALAWVPRRWRRSSLVAVIEIKAPVSRVFGFLAEPSNWSTYQDGIESVTVRPPGPLAVGSEVTVRQRYESHIRGPEMLPPVIETVSVISAIDRDRELSMHLANRPASSTSLKFSPSGDGTVVSSWTATVAPYRIAVFGGVVELRLFRRERQLRSRWSLGRLKQLMEEPPAQA